jgi:hypothetical protein
LFQDLIDSLPIPGVFLAFALLALVLYELGFRFGRWWQARTPEEKEGPTGMLVGSILALMAFLLAITMGMATDRFDTRRGLVLEEANDIGTTYLRAGYLPEPARTESRELLREYVPLRIVPAGATVDTLTPELARAAEIRDELWAIAEELATTTPEYPDPTALAVYHASYTESLNETIDVATTREVAGIYARVPETVLLLLFVGSALTLGVVGYSAGLTGRRSPLTAIVLIVVLGAVITLIIDIERPQGGSLTVSQVPLIQLQDQIGPPSLATKVDESSE